MKTIHASVERAQRERRRFLKLAVQGGIAVGGASLLAACHQKSTSTGSGTASGEVILTDGGGPWGKAQREAYYDPFEKATGIKVRTVPFVMPGKLRTSIEQGRPVIDVADMSGADLPAFERDGLLQAIDRHAIRAEDIDALAPLKASEFSVPSFYVSTVLAYRQSLFQGAEPVGWADLWATGRYRGGRSLASGALGQMGATFEIALLADGVPAAQLYPLDWDRAIRSLTRLRAKVGKYWQSSGEALQLLNDGSATMTSIWNGPIAEPQAQSAGNAFTWNQGILQSAFWAVPKGAPNSENAMRFIGFALQPERQAHFASLVAYSPANSRALALLDAQRRRLMPTDARNLDQQVVQDFGWWAKEAKPGVNNLTRAVQLWETWIQRA